MIKIHYLFFLFLLSIVNEVAGMHTKVCQRRQNEKIYFHHYNKEISFPIIQITHTINLCFHDAFLFIETDATLHRTKQTITSCCEHMEKLITIIGTDFDTFQRTSLKKIFECMKKSASKEEQDIITTQVLNELKWPNRSATNNLGNSIVSSLQAIQRELFTLNVCNTTPQEYYNQLNVIQEKYYEYLKSLDPKIYKQDFHYFHSPSAIGEAVQTLTSCVMTPQQDRVKLFSKKNYLERRLEEAPRLLPSSLQDISTKANLLSWVPFLNTKYVIQKIITFAAGQEAYNNLKKKYYFKAFRLLQKNNIVCLSWLVTTAHNILETWPVQFITKKQIGASFAEHSCNLQEYFFIGLCEDINRAHHNSLAMINRKKRFSFVLKKDIKIENGPVQAPEHTSIWTANNLEEEFSIGTNQVDGVIDALGTLLASTQRIIASVNSASNAAASAYSLVTSIAKSTFFSSMIPWNTLPTDLRTPIDNNQLQTNQVKVVIPAEVVTGNIQDFVCKLHHITMDNHNPMSAHRKFAGELQMISFRAMVKIHEELIRNMNMQYGLYASRNKSIPNTWDNLLSTIDKLYNTLVQLKEERKLLYFFNIWALIVNIMKRNETMKLLKKHIDIYNKTKINIYAKDSPYYDGMSYQFNADRTDTHDQYQKVRTAFENNCKFSHADNIDLFQHVRSNGSAYKRYLNVFNPLEQAELRSYVK